MKKIFNVIQDPDKAVVDLKTGEIISSFRTINTATVDDFIMVFINSLNPILNLNGLEIKILMCVWKKSSFYEEEEGNIFINNAKFKEYVLSQFNTTSSSIDSSICKLAKKNILIKRCKGEYLLNPKYFFKGRLSDRSKLGLKINYI